MKFISLPVLSLALLAACGDNLPAPVDPTPDAPAETHTGYALGTDFSEGVLSRLELVSGQVVTDVVSGVASGDPVLRPLADYLVVVNRGAANVTVLRRSPLSLVAQISTGAGSNPQDAALLGDKLYVPLYGGSGVAVIDFAADFALTTVDLGALDPNDDVPNCHSALVDGDAVFVTCQLLDDANVFAATGPGVVVKLKDGAAPESLALAGKNPASWLVKSPAGSTFGGKLLVAGTDSYLDVMVGCLYTIDPVTLASTCAIDNATLGGSITHMAVGADEATLWLAINKSNDFLAPNSVLAPFDLATGQLGAAISPPGQIITDLEACSNGVLLATDSQVGAGGIRVYDTQTRTEKTSTPLAVGLPPVFTDALACD